MANINDFIPVFLNLETGVILKDGESLGELFERSKKEGYNTTSSVCGINFEIYDEYRKSQGIERTSKVMLKVINFDDWANIIENEFWKKCKADSINSQRVANFIADWFFASNIECIKHLNKCLLNIDSYSIGSKLLKKINSLSEDSILNILISDRENYIDTLNIPESKRKHFINRFKNI